MTVFKATIAIGVMWFQYKAACFMHYSFTFYIFSGFDVYKSMMARVHISTKQFWQHMDTPMNFDCDDACQKWLNILIKTPYPIFLWTGGSFGNFYNKPGLVFFFFIKLLSLKAILDSNN